MLSTYVVPDIVIELAKFTNKSLSIYFLFVYLRESKKERERARAVREEDGEK